MNILMPARSGYAFGGEKSLTKQQGPASTDERQGGFTLIEILVVIGIIAILALIVLVAINPARQFALSRNTQRSSNVNAMLNAIGQRMVDNKGVFDGQFTINSVVYTCPDIVTLLTGTPNTPYDITTVANGTNDALGLSKNVDLSCLTPTYIPTFPFDPSKGQWTTNLNYDTAYTVSMDVNQRITICAPTLETSVGNAAICVTR